jgi:branched-subunit amino acid permease
MVALRKKGGESMSPVARESIKAASIISGTVAVVSLAIMLLTLGAWGERKADKVAVQATRERIVILETQQDQNTREHNAILGAIRDLGEKVDDLK